MKILGHRGARHEEPENTLLSIETALAAGVDGVEIDVHLSRDGRVVVIHDETVDRTTDGEGKVVELGFEELRRLDAGKGQKVPSLEEVLEAVRGKAELFIELKAPGCEAKVVEVVDRLELRGASFVKAFDHRWVQRTKELAPSLRTGCLIYGRPVDPVGLVRAAGADFLSIGIRLVDADLVAQCHAGGVEVCTWNCNEPDEVPHYAALGVDWLGTDAPTQVVPANV